MKKSILILALIGTIFTSCKTAQQKENAAKTNVAEAKQDLADIRADNAAEWKSYKASAQIKIADNKRQNEQTWQHIRWNVQKPYRKIRSQEYGPRKKTQRV
jgi:ABC-type transporter MlaC component